MAAGTAGFKEQSKSKTQGVYLLYHLFKTRGIEVDEACRAKTRAGVELYNNKHTTCLRRAACLPSYQSLRWARQAHALPARNVDDRGDGPGGCTEAKPP